MSSTIVLGFLAVSLAGAQAFGPAVTASSGLTPASAGVPDTVALKARPFPLRDVRLLDGPFKQAMQLDQEYLLALDPDRLLHTFRLNAGLPSTAAPLGGWEAPDVELRGHTAGHYLSALALMYAATGDDAVQDAGRRHGRRAGGHPGGAGDSDSTPGICRRFPRSSSIASRRARKSGRRTTRCTRSWRGCSTCISWRATRRR